MTAALRWGVVGTGGIAADFCDALTHSCCEVVNDEALFATGRSVLDALGWHGVAMVELKRHTADGRDYLMEVNPKLWGSLDLAIAAGADFPLDLVRIASGEELPELPSPDGPLRLCWPLGNDLRHLAARPGAWRAILGDWFGYPLAGNFRPYFPNARILNLLDWQIAVPQGADLGRLIPPPREGANGKCLLMWTPTGDGARKQAVLRKAELLLGVTLPPDTPAQYLTAEMHNGHGRTLTIAYILLPEGRGNCR